jgi:hypothetical protein
MLPRLAQNAFHLSLQGSRDYEHVPVCLAFIFIVFLVLGMEPRASLPVSHTPSQLPSF